MYISLKECFRLIVVVFLQIVAFFPLYAQSIQTFTVQNGLSNDWVRTFVKDDRGFMWIATQNGLNRFDGKNFEVYASAAKNSKHRLQNNEIISLTTDNQGNVLLRSRSHFELININTGDVVASAPFFDAIHSTKMEKGKMPFDAAIIYKTRDKNIYYYSFFARQLFKWNGLGKISFDAVFSVKEDTPPYDMIEDKDNNLWLLYDNFATKVGLNPVTNKWEEKERLWEKEREDSGYIPLEIQIFNTIFGINLSHYKWVNPKTGLTETLILTKKRLIHPTFLQYEDQFFWLNSENELLRIDTKHKLVSEVAVTKDKDWLNNNLLALYYTKPGTLWVGSFKGIKLFDLREIPFQKIFCNSDYIENGRISYGMRGISEDVNGNIVAIGNNRLLTFAPSNKDNHPLFTVLSPKNMGEASNLCIDNKNHYWICNPSYAINRIKLQSNSFSIDSQQFYPHAFYDMAWNNSQHIWGGGTDLRMIDTLQHSSKIHPFSEVLAKKEVNHRFIVFLRYTSDSALWVGGLDWLYRIPYPEKFIPNNWTRYGPNEKELKKIPSGDITEVREDRQHNIWVGTRGGGVVKINPKGDVIVRLTEADGLSNNTIAGILEADNGNIWISTFNGLNEYNPITKKIRNYYMKDGLAHYEFNIHSAYKSKAGTLYFGGLNGISSINPQHQLHEMDDSFTYKMVFTEVRWFSERKDTLVNVKNLRDAVQSIELGANDRSLYIQFALLNFIDTHNNYYSYKIDEHSEEWIELGHNPELQLPYLSSGSYTLHIRARQANGEWNKQELTLIVVVKQVFYKTFWFWCVIVLGIIGFIGAGYRYELSQLKKQQSLRTTIASDLHDEVGSLLTRLSMQAEMVQMLPFEKAQKMLIEIAVTSKNSIDYMRDIIWAIDARNDTPQDLVNRMEEHLSITFSHANIDYHFDTKSVMSQTPISPDIRQNVFLIFKEAIHNIIKHSDTQFVNIYFAYSPNELLLEIKEHLPTIVAQSAEKNKQTKGNGLAYMKIRAERIQADLTIEPENRYRIVLKKLFKKKLL